MIIRYLIDIEQLTSFINVLNPVLCTETGNQSQNSIELITSNQADISLTSFLDFKGRKFSQFIWHYKIHVFNER